MTDLDSILKSRDITLPTKICLVKAMVFPVVMYGYESWTIKKAELQRIDAFELWYWRRLLRVPWTARRSNQSILKVISPQCSLEGLMLKLKLQYFGHLMQRTDSFEKTLMLGKIEGERRREQQRMRWLDGWCHQLNGHEFEQAPEVGDGQGSLACCSPWGRKELDTTEWLNWTELVPILRVPLFSGLWDTSWLPPVQTLIRCGSWTIGSFPPSAHILRFTRISFSSRTKILKSKCQSRRSWL